MSNVVGTTLVDAMLHVEEGSWVEVTGCIDEGTFKVEGNLSSYKGIITTFGWDFNVEQVHLDLNTEAANATALTGKAIYTDFVDDFGIPSQIYLDIIPTQHSKLVDDDRKMRIKIFNSEIVINSDNPNITDDEILSQMGISRESINKMALRALTSGLTHYYFRQYLKPFERYLERLTSLDIVRFRPSIMSNNAGQSLFGTYYDPAGKRPDLFGGSQVTIGEALSHSLFMTWTGLIRRGPDEYQRYIMGMQQEFGLEYQVQVGTKIEFKYFYDPLINKQDRKIQLRHSFWY